MKGTLYKINIIPSWVASKSLSALYPGTHTGKSSCLWSLLSSALYSEKAASSRQPASSLYSPGPLPGLSSFARGKATSCRRHTQPQSIQPPLLTKEKRKRTRFFLFLNLVRFWNNHWCPKHSRHLINIITWINKPCKVGNPVGFLNPNCSVLCALACLAFTPTWSLMSSQNLEAGKLKAPLLNLLTAEVTVWFRFFRPGALIWDLDLKLR